MSQTELNSSEHSLSTDMATIALGHPDNEELSSTGAAKETIKNCKIAVGTFVSVVIICLGISTAVLIYKPECEVLLRESMEEMKAKIGNVLAKVEIFFGQSDTETTEENAVVLPTSAALTYPETEEIVTENLLDQTTSLGPDEMAAINGGLMSILVELLNRTTALLEELKSRDYASTDQHQVSTQTSLESEVTSMSTSTIGTSLKSEATTTTQPSTTYLDSNTELYARRIFLKPLQIDYVEPNTEKIMFATGSGSAMTAEFRHLTTNETMIVLKNATREPDCGDSTFGPNVTNIIAATGSFMLDQYPVICGGIIDGNINNFSAQCSQFNAENGSVDFRFEMQEKRAYAASVAINKSTLWITGGMLNRKQPLRSTELIDFDKESSRKGPNLPKPLHSHCMLKLNNDQVMIIGKFRQQGKTYFYDFPSDSWHEGPGLTIARKKHSCGAFESRGSTIVVVIGGQNNRMFLNNAEETMEMLDLKHGHFWKLAYLPEQIWTSFAVSSPNFVSIYTSTGQYDLHCSDHNQDGCLMIANENEIIERYDSVAIIVPKNYACE